MGRLTLDPLRRRVVFGLFFLSGFCSLSYQILWTRLAFASFGIITPVLSIVLSVFMLGLALGSFIGGRLPIMFSAASRVSPALWYAGAELLIAASSVLVPVIFKIGTDFLLRSGETDSAAYLLLSALVIMLALLPWCVAMGLTFPFMMAFVRRFNPQDQRSFSFLYAANVLGAMTGTALTAMVLIEALGFAHSLWVVGGLNVTIAAVSLWLSASAGRSEALNPGLTQPRSKRDSVRRPVKGNPELNERSAAAVLFLTGFGAMASEVIWTRDFTPVLKTQVYSFALIVLAYLAATLAGSIWYRRDLRKSQSRSIASLLGWLTVAVFLPILANDPRVTPRDWAYAIDWRSASIVLASICPMCLVLGYLTPRLIDDAGGGDPAVAGRAYAINVLGCILGPIVASYFLLPLMPARYALILVGSPFWLFLFLSRAARFRMTVGVLATIVAAIAIFVSQDFEQAIHSKATSVEVRRDAVASVVSASFGDSKTLLVNGIGMTVLSPVTKVMVHLPLALRAGPPKSILVICFGMGTTFRSAMSWNAETTAVELVPSVPKAFAFYHPDAGQLLEDPRGHIVIDDGRRFLARTHEKFDLIVVDPPPPPEAAGSSLLFSQEFTRLAQQHLNPHGILQTWYIGQDILVFQALLRSVADVFPYLRTFGSIEGWGIHVTGSMDPIEIPSPHGLAMRMPPSAQRDLMEWAPAGSLEAYLSSIVSRELSVEKSLNPDPSVRITDDRPLNEYFLLRR